MHKIGRNDPCPCGYGIKFKYCCQKKGIVYLEEYDIIKRLLISRSNELKDFNVQYGLLVGTPIVWVRHNGYRATFTGTNYYIRNKNETFQEFLIHQLKHGMGWRWGANEQLKTEDEKHVCLKWLSSLGDQTRSQTDKDHQISENLYTSEASGDTLMYLCFAYDFFTLRNARQLSPNKKKELLRFDKFQSARYEISVAAIFVRSGFEIEWLDDKTASDQHPEFIATNKITHEKVAVEVKSRCVPGTYHTKSRPSVREISSWIKSKVTEAGNQIPDDIPGMIFCDLNLPPETCDPEFNSGITKVVMNAIGQTPIPTMTSPSKENAVMFTNWSWHYFGKDGAKPATMTIKSFSVYPKNHLKTETHNLINRALEEYGQVPYPVFE